MVFFTGAVRVSHPTASAFPEDDLPEAPPLSNIPPAIEPEPTKFDHRPRHYQGDSARPTKDAGKFENIDPLADVNIRNLSQQLLREHGLYTNPSAKINSTQSQRNYPMPHTQSMMRNQMAPGAQELQTASSAGYQLPSTVRQYASNYQQPQVPNSSVQAAALVPQLPAVPQAIYTAPSAPLVQSTAHAPQVPMAAPVPACLAAPFAVPAAMPYPQQVAVHAPAQQEVSVSPRMAAVAPQQLPVHFPPQLANAVLPPVQQAALVPPRQAVMAQPHHQPAAPVPMPPAAPEPQYNYAAPIPQQWPANGAQAVPFPMPDGWATVGLPEDRQVHGMLRSSRAPGFLTAHPAVLQQSRLSAITRINGYNTREHSLLRLLQKILTDLSGAQSHMEVRNFLNRKIFSQLLHE